MFTGFRKPKTLYEMIEFEHILELMDTKGMSAINSKRKKIRFLHDNIFAIQDHVWGDGELFSGYKCSPGVPVDHYREGQGYAVVISLQETKKRDDIEEFTIERCIQNGFLSRDESFQTKVFYPTALMTIKVIFPRKRTPKRMVLLEQNTGRKIPLTEDNIHFLPDGRQEVVWSTNNPQISAVYSLRWHW